MSSLPGLSQWHTQWTPTPSPRPPLGLSYPTLDRLPSSTQALSPSLGHCGPCFTGPPGAEGEEERQAVLLVSSSLSVVCKRPIHTAARAVGHHLHHQVARHGVDLICSAADGCGLFP